MESRRKSRRSRDLPALPESAGPGGPARWGGGQAWYTGDLGSWADPRSRRDQDTLQPMAAAGGPGHSFAPAGDEHLVRVPLLLGRHVHPVAPLDQQVGSRLDHGTLEQLFASVHPGHCGLTGVRVSELQKTIDDRLPNRLVLGPGTNDAVRVASLQVYEQAAFLALGKCSGARPVNRGVGYIRLLECGETLIEPETDRLRHVALGQGVHSLPPGSHGTERNR